jgi:ABC-2 type transport system ATP-binding protein
MNDSREEPVKNLTENQRRKTQVAMALLGKPRVLVFDEPTMSVDVLTRRKIWDVLKKAKNDSIVVVAT